MLSTNDQVAKLQALLARVQTNANQPGARLAHRWPGSVWGGPASDAMPLAAAAVDVAASRPTSPPVAVPAHVDAPVVMKAPVAAPVVPAAKAPIVPAVVATPLPVAAKPAPAAKPAVPARPPVPAARPKVPSRVDDAARSSVTSSPTPAPVVAQSASVGEPASPLLRSPALSLHEEEATIVAGKGYDGGEAASRQAAILAAVARHGEANRQSESNIAGSTAATVSAAVSFGAQSSAAEPRAAQLEPIVLKTSLPDEPEVANFIGLGPTTGVETIGDLLAAALSF
jgi:hypothetical protein